MGNFIYNLLQIVQSEWFPYFAIAWLSIAVIYDALNGWPFWGVLAQLAKQPIIFMDCNPVGMKSNPGDNNDNANSDSGEGETGDTSSEEGNDMETKSPTDEPGNKDIPFYPRQLLEQVACALKSFFTWPIYRLVLPPFKRVIEGVYSFDSAKTQETFLSVFFAVFLSLFAYGDSIAIANGLDALGLVRGEVPTFLLYYEFAVGIATFLAIIVGFFVLFESFVQRDETALAHFGGDDVRRLTRGISLIIILIGVGVAALLGIGRIMALGYWEGNETLALVVQFGINVLTLVNGILAAALVFGEGIKGYRVVFALFLWAVALLLLIADLTLFIGARGGLFAVDIIWRAVYMGVGVLLFVAFVPLIALIRTLLLPFRFLIPRPPAA